MDLKSKIELLKYSEFEVEKILARYNKDVGNIEKDVEIIRNWMEQQKHLPFIFNDRYIFTFLNINEFSLEKAKTCIDMYFTLKGEFPEFYSFAPSHPDLKSFRNNYNLFPLPKLSKNQGRIIASQITDPKYFDFDKFACLVFHILEVLNYEDVNSGWEIILDFTYASTEMMEKFTEEDIAKIFFILEKIYYKHMISLHIITSSVTEKFMERIWKNTKPIVQGTIVAHKSYETLMDYFSKDLLPKDFGGNLKTLEDFKDDWEKYIQERDVHLTKHMNAKTYENLRTFEISDVEVLEFVSKHGNRKLSSELHSN